jgi:hypothetical protein
VALHEQRVFLRVKSRRNVNRKRFVSSLAKLGGNLSYSYRVLVNYTVYAVIFVLKRSPVLYRTKIVTDSQISTRLNSAKYCFLLLFHFFEPLFFSSFLKERSKELSNVGKGFVFKSVRILQVTRRTEQESLVELFKARGYLGQSPEPLVATSGTPKRSASAGEGN